jgi:hypothetical protein
MPEMITNLIFYMTGSLIVLNPSFSKLNKVLGKTPSGLLPRTSKKKGYLLKIASMFITYV